MEAKDEIRDEDDNPKETQESSENPTLRESLPEIAEPKVLDAGPKRHVGRWVLILVGTLLVGFAAAFFWQALPAQQALKQAVADLAETQEKLAASEADLKATSDELGQTISDLADAEYALALARVQANVAYARSSLVSRDLLTARQEVSAAVKNLETLLTFIQDTDTAAALKERMQTIDSAVYTDSAKALAELRSLSENLLRLENR